MSVLALQRSQLVASVYEAALAPSRWQQFLSELVYATGSTVGIIWAHDFSERSVQIAGEGADQLFCSVGLSASALSQFDAHYGAINVWLQDPELHQAGSVVCGDKLFPNARLKQTEYWADWLRPCDIFHTIAAVVERSPTRSMNATVCRPEAAGPYSAQELQTLTELVPHLKTGFALHRQFRQLDALRGASTAVLDAMHLGVLLLDESMQLLHANTRATALLHAAHDVVRLSANGLSCVRSRDDQKLQQLLRGAGQTGVHGRGSAGGPLRLMRMRGDQLQLFVAPLPSWSGPFGLRAATAVFITQPNDGSINLQQALRAVYQLSPAESRLTEALVNGLSPKEYGDQAGVSIHTVRTQMKSAAAKVGVNRQLDLVRTVLLGPALLARTYAPPDVTGR